MRFVRYAAGGSPEGGVLTDDGIAPLTGTTLGPVTFEKLANDSYLERVRDRLSRTNHRIDPETVRLLAPVESPGKIVCVGLNYHDHAEE